MNLIEKVKEEFWPKLKTVVSKIPFTEDLIALYYSMMDPETPFRTKLIIAGALIYFPVGCYSGFYTWCGISG